MATELPAEMEALIIRSPGLAEITTAPLPKLRDGYILVRTTAVAVNPSDWKHINYMWVGDPTGTRPGLDYAGVVVDVGPGVEKDFKIGDRVCGVCHGSNVRQKEDGTFAEYLVAKAGLQIKIPSFMKDTEAAAMGSGLASVVGSRTLPVPGASLADKPVVEANPLLIYGGSTASGVMGIQFAKMSGCVVATMCSPKNFDYVKSLGADFCVDYNAEDCSEQIKAFFKGRLRHSWDCISTVQSARICAAAMSEKGGKYSSLLYLLPSIVKKVNPKVTTATTIGYTIMGDEFEKETIVEARPEDYEFGKMFFQLSEDLLHDERFRPVKQRVNEGCSGLQGVLHGLEYLKQGKTSAEKLVYTIDSSS